MSDYTPTEARVCIDFCNAAMKRRQPDGSFMDMEEADAAFSRWMAAHDAALRAEWEAEQGEVGWEFRVVGDYVAYESVKRLRKDFRAPTVVIERRRKAGPWQPVDQPASTPGVETRTPNRLEVPKLAEVHPDAYPDYATDSPNGGA